jgi:hypothetical protein
MARIGTGEPPRIPLGQTDLHRTHTARQLLVTTGSGEVAVSDRLPFLAWRIHTQYVLSLRRAYTGHSHQTPLRRRFGCWIGNRDWVGQDGREPIAPLPQTRGRREDGNLERVSN